ncbi:hypothetical protein OB905_07240 [Halobacteria archaeon AArc-dxtr1]|nr:hypothetical protein [Halobacteria archaeon AArc-dxtr1]
MSIARYDLDPDVDRKYVAALYISALALAIAGAFFGLLYALGEFGTYVRSLGWAAGWYALAVYVAWWTVYYRSSKRPDQADPTLTEDACVDLPEGNVVTLRTFLTYNTPRGRSSNKGKDLAEKAARTIQTVGVIVGFSLLVFSFTLQMLYTESPAYHEAHIFTAVLGVQLIAIANFLIAIDSLDTTTNEFDAFSPEMIHEHRQTFYDRGIANYYRGLSILVFSMFLLTMIVLPVLTAVGVLAFAYYGYNYWFGYTEYA